jgi:hypothetical protein
VDRATTPGEFEAALRRRIEMDYSIHYHVWRDQDMLELFDRMRRELGLSYEVAAWMTDFTQGQVIVVLRKLA